MHPFTPNLSTLSDEELMTKIIELHSKARMLAGNVSVQNQLQNLISDYRHEQLIRATKQREETDDKYSSIIDIGKNNNG